MAPQFKTDFTWISLPGRHKYAQSNAHAVTFSAAAVYEPERSQGCAAAMSDAYEAAKRCLKSRGRR
uniref:Uncharacterized protein n=1 Tax=Hyaloperonospora arabidopsidis (strain Emoy2) TaxID=559515 RepID=M4BDT0_HYAAE